MSGASPSRPAPQVATPGPFGHHPDLSTDFCIEVEDLEGYAYEISVGLNFVPGHRSQWPFWGRLSRALAFTRSADGLDDIARRAIPILHTLEGKALAKGAAPAGGEG